jgi:hypothetical protein
MTRSARVSLSKTGCSVRRAVIASVLVSCPACSTSICDSAELNPPVIRVVDASSGEPICDAVVVAVAGPGVGDTDADRTFDTLAPVNLSDAEAASCVYANVAVLSAVDGTYTLQASKSGYVTTTVSGVVVETAQCNNPLPAAQQVTIKLTPQ